MPANMDTMRLMPRHASIVPQIAPRILFANVEVQKNVHWWIELGDD
jgi:hypothetical protein